MKNMKKILLFALTLVVMVSTLSIFSHAQTDSSILYQNDFSSAAGMSDFTSYRGDWYIKDGGLYVKAADNFADNGDMFAHLLYTKEAFNVENYMVDVDIFNLQTSTGILGRCDASKASDETNNSWYGYLCFMSNDATKAAIGYGNADGGYGGNLHVSGAVASKDMNIHLNVKFAGYSIIFTITDLATGNVLYTYEQVDVNWSSGTFGLRVRLSNAATSASSIDQVYFDNLVVRKLSDKGETEAVATTAASTTAASTTAASTTAAGTTAVAETTAPASEGSTQTGDLAVILAVAMIAAVCSVVIIKRKALTR